MDGSARGRYGGTRRSAILCWCAMNASVVGARVPARSAGGCWAAAGDINAFFGLMLDNVVNLAVLAGILVAGFGFPVTLVYTRMFPGTALGVLFGDVVY